MRDVVIIGSGPAGLSAAVYLKRAMLDVLVIEKEPFSGGQMLTTEKVENYLGFSEIGGFELADKFRKHAESLGAEFLTAEVVSVDFEKSVLKNGREILSRARVIASGTSHRKLGAENEENFAGRGVSYCATCDGAFFRGKDVAVIGGGDTALEDAIYLAALARKVTLIHRRDKLRAAPVLQHKFFSLPNVEFIGSEEVTAFKGGNVLESIELKSGKEISVNGCFVAVGQIPNTSFVPECIKIPSGYIATGELCETALNGIFAAGDVRDKPCRQIITAAADGALVSKGVLSYLR